MSFPLNPTNGQQATVNGLIYSYNSTIGAWTVATQAQSISLTVTSIGASGNVSGNYILGNAAFMSGIPASYTDSNVTSLLASFGSNVISGTGNITTSGNVGIGTATPDQKLQVVGSNSTGFAGATLQNTNQNIGLAGVQFSSDTIYSKSAIAQVRESPNGVGPLVFYVDSNTDAANWSSGDEKVRITAAGDVGIGTSSNLGSSKLDVRGRIRTGTGNSSGDAEVIWSNYASATTAWNVSVRQDVGGANNDLKFLRFDSNGNYQGVAMQINSAAGNVVINTTTASTTTTTGALVVAGGAGIAGNLNVGALSAGSITETSSRYLKTNFRRVENALETVLHLSAWIYDRKDGSETDELGLVAEEVDPVIKNIVMYDDLGKPTGIKYTRVGVLCIEAIKDLHNEIQELKQLINK